MSKLISSIFKKMTLRESLFCRSFQKSNSVQIILIFFFKNSGISDLLKIPANRSQKTSDLLKKHIFRMFLPVFPHFYAKRVNCSHHSSLSCSLFQDMSPLDRVGNSLFGFLSRWLVFCERKSEISICSWKRVNRS